MMAKECNQCQTDKSVEEFYKKPRGKYGVAARCKKCYSASAKAKRASESISINSRRRELYPLSREKILRRNAKYQSNRYKNDPVFKLWRSISKELRQALNGDRPYNEGSRLHKVTGLTGSELQSYLYSTFKKRYGIDKSEVNLREVEIDHIVPISTSESIYDVNKLNHYTNLQLLRKEDNVEKRDKLTVNKHQGER